MCALEFVLTPPKEIAIVCDDAQPLLDVVFGEYRPNHVVAWKRAAQDLLIPLLEGRAIIDNNPTAYACVNLVCRMPVTDAELLKAILSDYSDSPKLPNR